VAAGYKREPWWVDAAVDVVILPSTPSAVAVQAVVVQPDPGCRRRLRHVRLPAKRGGRLQRRLLVWVVTGVSSA